MFSSSPTIQRADGEKPDQVELNIFQALLDMETDPDLEDQLQDLSFITVKIYIDSSQKYIIELFSLNPSRKPKSF